MAAEHYTTNRKSDDFLNGMETAIQEEMQTRWSNAPAERPTILSVAGMPGMIGMHIPAPIPTENPRPKISLNQKTKKRNLKGNVATDFQGYIKGKTWIAL